MGNNPDKNWSFMLILDKKKQALMVVNCTKCLTSFENFKTHLFTLNLWVFGAINRYLQPQPSPGLVVDGYGSFTSGRKMFCVKRLDKGRGAEEGWARRRTWHWGRIFPAGIFAGQNFFFPGSHPEVPTFPPNFSFFFFFFLLMLSGKSNCPVRLGVENI